MSALVTGASGGLGAALAVALAGAGHDVGVHYRGDRAGAEAVAAAVEARRAPRPSSSTPTSPSRAPTTSTPPATPSSTPAPTPSAPSTSSSSTPSPRTTRAWADLDTAAWDALHRGGLRPTTALLHRATARMGAGGVAVAVGSIEGLRPTPTHAAYAVAKAALHHLVAAAAHELGPRGIRVVGVAPGLVDREGLEEAWPEGVAPVASVAALGRPVAPEEVAAAVAFLASPAASGITGTILTVDAGWSAAPGW